MIKPIVSTGDAPGKPYRMVLQTSGEYLFLSGQGPVDLVKGEVVRDSLENQMRRTLDNVVMHLENAGATLANVVSCRVYLSELNDDSFALLNRVYLEYFGDAPPTRTTIGCQLINIDFEVDCIACVDPSR